MKVIGSDMTSTSNLNFRKYFPISFMLIFSFYVFMHGLSNGTGWRIIFSMVGFTIFLSLFTAILYRRHIVAKHWPKSPFLYLKWSSKFSTLLFENGWSPNFINLRITYWLNFINLKKYQSLPILPSHLGLPKSIIHTPKL